MTRASANFCQFVEGFEWYDRREIEALIVEGAGARRKKRLEPGAAFGPRFRPKIFAVREEHVIDPHKSRCVGQHFRRDGFAVQALLEIGEGRSIEITSTH